MNKIYNENNFISGRENPNQISIWIDNYDDIFSDFDPRSYITKSLSDDFIKELKKVSNDSKDEIKEFILLVPSKLRNAENEIIIADRLHKYFSANYQETLKFVNKTKFKGFIFAIVGIILMLLASYISPMRISNFLLNILFVIFEPSGWFLVWMGLEDIFNAVQKWKSELNFFLKLSKAKIHFKSY